MRIDAGLFVGKQEWIYYSVWSIRNEKESIWMNEGGFLVLYSAESSVYVFQVMERFCFILHSGVEEEACLLLIGCTEYTQDTAFKRLFTLEYALAILPFQSFYELRRWITSVILLLGDSLPSLSYPN